MTENVKYPDTHRGRIRTLMDDLTALMAVGVQQDRAAEEAQRTLNAAYRERAHLVALLAAAYPAEFRENPEDPDWPIVYVQLPTGQASLHISPDDMDLFAGVRFGTDAEWDGHTTEAKYLRIDKLTHMLHVEGGIEAVGGHRGAR